LLTVGGLLQLSGPRVGAGHSGTATRPRAVGSLRATAPAADAREAVRALLARRDKAVLHRRPAVLAATAVPADRARQAELLRRTAAVPLAAYSHRLTRLTWTTAGLTAEVRLDHRVAGYDRHPATATRRITLERTGGQWLLASDDPVGGVLLWDLGTVQALPGTRSLVLGLGERTDLVGLARAADRAVPAVSAVWGTDWADRLLLYAPASLD